MSAQAKLQGLKHVAHTHSILTIVRETTKDSVEVSPDFGTTWTKFPLSEIADAEPIKEVTLPRGNYHLVRLLLKEDHPSIESIALRAQVDFLRSSSACSCTGSAGQPSGGVPTLRMNSQCGEICADESGCGWWACVYWCGFLR
jgi:hypothetical protein